MARRRMIALCTYPLAASGAHDMLDVARVHNMAFAVRQGRWEVLAIARQPANERGSARERGALDIHPLKTVWRGKNAWTRTDPLTSR